MGNPTGPTVVVVGGSSGLGKVVARRWARDGYRVAIVSRNIPAFIGESDILHHFPADLVTLSSDAANQLAERIISSLGKITYVMFCQLTGGHNEIWRTRWLFRSHRLI
jgi:Dehydrogenases with different specificities (related to short-chain alcohol dehydrogenases)